MQHEKREDHGNGSVFQREATVGDCGLWPVACALFIFYPRVALYLNRRPMPGKVVDLVPRIELLLLKG